ncbi:MAG: serine hydroxymethyltransferase [Deltaproteobacteria bacterium CG2_30_63_29]|nr:MAG: serine hydroxymethyltransferase [Deltaproteobacteria bacterium CG2_30_63_29]PIV98351.1 MAG: serine hydroxymethyltransferase [Deltaproteobacteria bacterium CG17_big_fil_post_rev_8_21_14_2_50_63_7]PJB33788.1 MAG: serine hydroxymethyltransferase [Deltaproteobacteria bacterium CG_4_9_14_3_um_filter_63_12]
MAIESIRTVDPEIFQLISAEERRQRDSIRLIASENYASKAVLAAVGSVLSNKYAEGYPGRRYYNGQVNTDAIERCAIERAKDLFGAQHANVQAYSGSPANMAVYAALCEPGDPIVGLSLPHGGHLSHGWKVNFSGKLYDAHQYPVSRETELIDLEVVRELCHEVKPKVLSVGTTAYPRAIDFEGFAAVAKEVGAYLVADVAHVSGLIAGGAYPNPVPFADVVTSTTHKTLRGPRGGLILCRQDLAKAIDRAVFPGLQGGPHMNQITALAVALKEASTPEYARYCAQVIANARALAAALEMRGFRLVTGGTDSHIVLVDLTPKGVAGRIAADALERAGIVCNSNTIPYDPRTPFDPSGIRIGTPCVTSRGMKEPEMEQIAVWIADVVENVEDETVIKDVRTEILQMVKAFPAPGLDF